MITKVMVIYSKHQKVRRRLIKLSEGQHDGCFDNYRSNLHPGESYLYIPLDIFEEFTNDSEIDDYISLKIGERKNDRCALVCSQGIVREILCADPEIDFHSTLKLVECPEAHVGWLFENNEFKCPDVLNHNGEVKIKNGLYARDDWDISISNGNLTIGCKTLPISEWEKLSASEVGLFAEKDRQIETAKWWEKSRDNILNIAKEYNEVL